MKNHILFLAWGVFAASFLMACAQTPQTYLAEGETCDLDLYAYDLEVELPVRTALRRGPNFSDVQTRSIRENRAPLLFLSGGSQSGAFGAGYLDEWSKLNGGLPKFSVVTGISTGALQSTAAFTGRPELAVKVAAITSESDLLEAYIDGTEIAGGLKLGAVTSLIRRGAISDLVPLRVRLDEIITEDLLLEVAKGGDENRKLYVGVTDFDTGGAVAMDMTTLAQLYRDNPSKRQIYKTCYREILIASSIVPVAAKPVFLDNRMYIDGGVRFGVFTEDIGPLLREKNERRGAFEVSPIRRPLETPIHIILNGDGVPSRQCGKPEEFCDGNRPKDINVGPHKNWSFPSLAVRAVDLLSNQVSRLSVDRASNLERDFENVIRFAKIDETEKDAFKMNSDLLPSVLQPQENQTLTCRQWREVDDSPINALGESQQTPVEFHPRYMHCLIAYGRSIAANDFAAWQF